MPETKSPSWRRYGIAAAACLILAFQAAAMRSLNIDEEKIPIPGLHRIPMQIENWKASGEQSMDANTVAYLRPDEYIMRDYLAAQGGAPINVFVAYFKSLQSKYGPHSPRICLPGAGWLVSSSKIVMMPVPGRSEGIPVNQFTMEKSTEHILVLYWYQNDRDSWAEDFYGKIRLLPDLVRYHRSDVSLVRLISPYQGSASEKSLAGCRQFAQQLYPMLVERFQSAHQNR